MGNKRHSSEQIVHMLRQAEVGSRGIQKQGWDNSCQPFVLLSPKYVV